MPHQSALPRLNGPVQKLGRTMLVRLVPQIRRWLMQQIDQVFFGSMVLKP
ncbi:hypothetical protein ASAP_0960 [Asaia bogorensis]|uniref:Uncharacterized protein n=1 Tax=Asaia bogorensis TaxID=91915 RepID=A0A060QDJ2_9PROT|nr:hypothetical protein ASAP_0960 [Asaia bogorensis]